MTDSNAATLTRSSPATTAKAKSTSASGVQKFALDAVNAQVGRVSEILVSAADTIDELLGNNASLPEAAKSFAASASTKLRGLADRANEDEASKLLESLQRNAAEHPLATAGIGAAIGTALGLALSRLGRVAPGSKRD